MIEVFITKYNIIHKQKLRTRKERVCQTSELNFISFCKENRIEYARLDYSNQFFFREKFLNNPYGKCPDFWCNQGGKQFFVEIKNLLKGNSKYNKKKKLSKYHQNNTYIEMGFNSFFIGSYRRFLGNAEEKFANIKSQYSSFSKILLIDNSYGYDFDLDIKLDTACYPDDRLNVFDGSIKNVDLLLYINHLSGKIEGIINPFL